MIQTVIFDMDGVLTDSEPVINAAAIQGLREYGISPEPADFEPFVGMGEDRYIGGVAEKYGLVYEPGMKRRVYEIYLEILPDTLRGFPGVHALLDDLAERGVSLAVASSADRIKVQANLRGIGVDLARFGAVVTGEDVIARKPAPDIFLAAAGARCGTGHLLRRRGCLEWRDGSQGCLGMRCVAVATSFSESALHEAGADATRPALADLTIGDLGVAQPGGEPMGGRRVWVIGDIHGMFDPLCALLQHIRYLDETLDEPAKIVFLGDYIDYGPSPRQVVDLLLRTREERETVFLCGNHEDLLLQFLGNSALFRQFGNVWFRGNGGQDTVGSFTTSPELFRRVYHTPEEYCSVSPDEFQMAPKYLAFFTSLQYSHTDAFQVRGGTLPVAFCHANLFQPSPNPRQPSPSDAVTVEQQLGLRSYDQFHQFGQENGVWIEQTHIWNRSEPIGRFGDYFLVQGHTPTCCLKSLGLPVGNYDVDSGLPFVSFTRPDVVARLTPRRLYFEAALDEVISVNIDTGAIYGSSLTALGLGEEGLGMGELDVIQARVGGNHRNWDDVEHFVMRFSGGLRSTGHSSARQSQVQETGENPCFTG